MCSPPCPPQLRVFVEAPPSLGAFRQELNQSPLLFRESSASPDQEERIRRKDAIIQTRNAQVGTAAGRRCRRAARVSCWAPLRVFQSVPGAEGPRRGQGSMPGGPRWSAPARPCVG